MMTLEVAINGVEAFMTEQAKGIAKASTDLGTVPHYSAKKHSGAAGKYLAKVVGEGLVLDAMAATLLFHSLANHSAWRQKFTKAKIFPEVVKEASAEGTDGKTKLSKAERMRIEFMKECGIAEEATPETDDGDEGDVEGGQE